MTLSWTAPTDRDTSSVIVYVASSPDGPFAALNLGDPIYCGQSLFTVHSLNANQSYWFRVTARDVLGNESAPTPVVSATPF